MALVKEVMMVCASAWWLSVSGVVRGRRCWVKQTEYNPAIWWGSMVNNDAETGMLVVRQDSGESGSVGVQTWSWRGFRGEKEMT